MAAGNRKVLILVLGVMSISSASPYYSLNIKTDLPLALGSLVIAGLGQYAYHSLDEVKLEQISGGTLPIWDRWAAGHYSERADLASDAGLIFTILPLAILTIGNLRDNKIKATITDAAMYAEAVVLSSGLYLLVRGLGDKPRPLVHSSKAPLNKRTAPDASSSFYSGHASGAFMTAVFTSCIFQKRRPNSKGRYWLWTGTLAAAATTALFRVYAGKHYPSDVLAGCIIGSSIGFIIPFLHSTHSKKVQMALAPKGRGILLQFSLKKGPLINN